jgi:PEGA domain-containing protein/tetratricopeptide repeat protein
MLAARHRRRCLDRGYLVISARKARYLWLLTASTTALAPLHTAAAEDVKTKGVIKVAQADTRPAPRTSAAPRPGTAPATKPPSAAAPAAAAVPATPRPTGAANAAAPTAAPSAPGAAAGPSNAETEKARALWYRGVEAFRAGDYEAARVAFEQCYKLMPKTDVLRNLSISELESGHYVSGARHLTQLLKSPEALNEKARKEAEKRLAQAEAQVGRLAIVVDVTGADVVVDGVNVGKSPLDASVYVEPGQHVLLVSKQGYPTEQRQLFALAGVAIPVEVSLDALRRKQEQAALTTSATPLPVAPAQPPSSALPEPESDGIGAGSIALLAGAGTVAVAGLVGGLVFSKKSDEHKDRANEISADLPPSPSACEQVAELQFRCDELHDAEHDAAIDRRWATAGFITFGVAAAGTIGYALWLGFSDSAPPLQATVDVGEGSAGIRVRGAF